MSRSVGRRSLVVGWTLIAVVALAACDPGWVNPIAGTGDGSGTPAVPGVPVAEDGVAFTNPTSVAVSPVNSDVYVVDATECTISKIADGKVSLVAGVAGSCGNTGDEGPATAAQIQPSKPYVAPDGSLYFRQGPVEIRHVTADGVIHTVPYANPTGTTNPGIATYAVDAAGTVTVLQSTISFFSTSARLYESEITADGTQTTVSENNGSTTVFSGVPVGPDSFILVQGTSATSTVVYSLGGHNLPAGSWTALDDAYFGSAQPTLLAAGDGRIYLKSSSGIYRGDPDGTTVAIAGNGSADPETTRYSGMAGDQPVSVGGAALTPNNGLVFTSGHVVYRLADPAHAAVTTTTVP